MTSLTPNELSSFEMRLNSRRDAVLAAIQDHLHRVDDPSKMTLHSYIENGGDWMDAGLINDAELSKLHKKLAELHDIDAALNRIKHGTYGICIGCGDPIPTARLGVQITSEYCLDCRKNFEKRASLTRYSPL